MMTTKRISLAQQIAQLQDTAPVDFDPEDTQFHATEILEGEDVSSARKHYFAVGPSALRRQRASIADSKYDGVRKTRTELMQAEEFENAEVNNQETHSEADDQFHEEPERSESDNESVYSDQGDDDDQVSSQSEEEEHQKPQKTSFYPDEPEQQSQDLGSLLQQNREVDLVKGRAISRQIAIWDTLLDARIRLQKCASSANKLPAPADMARFLDIPECRDSLNKMFEEALCLSEELFSLQEHLLSYNEAVTPPPRKKCRTSPIMEDGFSNCKTGFIGATESASSLEHLFHGHLIRTLSKWSSKVQAVAPAVLLASSRNSFSSRSSHHLKTAVQLIDEILTDYAKVIARTQVPRGKVIRIGRETPEAPRDDTDRFPDIEIFDDTDFYQQLLRDVIDSRGHGMGNTEDWTAMQKQRKLKKKVDTKASKGRKLRHEVHEKLQNFMVPVPVPGSWHDEQIDELFASLLGKGFEDVYVDSIVDLDHNNSEHDDGEVWNGGFRVFG